jgi:hypothetical protein
VCDSEREGNEVDRDGDNPGLRAQRLEQNEMVWSGEARGLLL